jgi:hypothetical protein
MNAKISNEYKIYINRVNRAGDEYELEMSHEIRIHDNKSREKKVVKFGEEMKREFIIASTLKKI